MRLYQSNKLNMYDGVLSFLKLHQAIVNTTSMFANSLAEFEATVTELKTKETSRQSATQGKTEAKYAAEDILIDSAIKIAAGLYTYARKNNLIELKNLADVNYSRLLRLKDVDLAIKCDQLYIEAQAAGDKLNEFGVSAADITSFKLMKDDFENKSSGRDASVAVRKGAVVSIADLFQKADDILENELDRFADQFKTTQIDFYNGYYGARMIKNIGIRHEEEAAEPAMPV